MTNPIHFISLGPGDPELITVKGLKLLQQADLIFTPATNTEKGPVSRATDILKSLDISEKNIQPFVLPMSKDRTKAHLAYDKLYTEALKCFDQRLRVVIVAEGDAGFYSSIQYIYDKFTKEGIPVQRTAGIPAFIAAGALAGLHIVKQEERVIVIPGTASPEDIAENIAAGHVVVIMKLSGCREAIHKCISHCQANFHYFENVGTDKEFYTNNKELLLTKEFPYFSLLIIQPMS